MPLVLNAEQREILGCVPLRSDHGDDACRCVAFHWARDGVTPAASWENSPDFKEIALHFPVTASPYSRGRIMFGDDLVIPSSGELALLRSHWGCLALLRSHWGCSAPLQLHVNIVSSCVYPCFWAEMLKERGCGTEWSRPALGHQAPSCEPSQRQRLGFTAGAWLLISLSPQPPLEGIDGWFWQELFYFVLGNAVISAVCRSAWGWVLELLWCLHWYILRQLRMILCSSPKVLAHKKVL